MVKAALNAIGYNCKEVSHHLTLVLALVFTCLLYKTFENTVGKGEIARKEQLLLFPEFSIRLENFLPFSLNLKLSPSNSFVWKGLKLFVLERVKGSMVATKTIHVTG